MIKRSYFIRATRFKDWKQVGLSWNVRSVTSFFTPDLVDMVSKYKEELQAAYPGEDIMIDEFYQV